MQTYNPEEIFNVEDLDGFEITDGAREDEPDPIDLGGALSWECYQDAMVYAKRVATVADHALADEIERAILEVCAREVARNGV